jgi:hypothetical protein
MLKGGIARAAQALAPRVAQSFFNLDRIHYSMFGVQCSMFDVHFLVNPSYETSQGQSFF